MASNVNMVWGPLYTDPELQEVGAAARRSQSQVLRQGGQIAERGERQSQLGDLATARANIEAGTGTPARMWIKNLTNGVRLDAQFNPEKLKEKIGASWQKYRIPGLSYERMQWGNSSNLVETFELIYDAAAGVASQSAPQPGQAANYSMMAVAQLEAARRFLHAATLPHRGDVLSGGEQPPRLLFDWPGFITLTCIMPSVDIEYEQFNSQGQPIRFRASVQLEEIRDASLYAEDVFASGTQRSGAARMEA